MSINTVSSKAVDESHAEKEKKLGNKGSYEGQELERSHVGLVCFHDSKLQQYCYWGLLVFAFYSFPVCAWNPDSVCMPLISSARRTFIHSSSEASSFIRGARVLARREADGYYYLGHIAQEVKVAIYCSVSLFSCPCHALPVLSPWCRVALL